ncbi:hypothetical protein X805_15560 [Sphaerotilus natans subsp. natans DSM 6575]|uniref:Uncharacterized protein n=1 Tax=Sphaerotilus natans subsp. natans DSM 6575 TaxID=1286631 RepID=A0A059KMV9_9BURK|nr:hypothetical protein [Sphaerotilus natans]KDB52822.1 hypothetical protein X805_15560 [Sphaerotilus natans subsp. natans DSM 6575]
MNTPPPSSSDFQAIESSEQELRELMGRVMDMPLAPLRQQVERIEERLEAGEDMCRRTADEDLPAVQAGLSRSFDEALRRVRQSVGSASDQLGDLLEAGLARTPATLEQANGALEALSRQSARSGQDLAECLALAHQTAQACTRIAQELARQDERLTALERQQANGQAQLMRQIESLGRHQRWIGLGGGAGLLGILGLLAWLLRTAALQQT